MNVVVFAVAAAAIWVTGRRLAAVVASLGRVTGLGQAIAGALLLGGITSLPEAATMTTAGVLGDAPLATGGLFGSVATNVLILAAADLASPRPLMSVVARRQVVRFGVIVLALLGVTAVAITAGDPLGTVVGAWPAVVFGCVVGAFGWLQRRGGEPSAAGEPGDHRDDDASAGRLVATLCGLGAVIVVAGYAGATAADALAVQWGLSSGLVGFVLLALATSLPEVGATFGAVRIGRPDLAVSNIFGTNLVNMALLLPTDVAYLEGRLLDDLGASDVATLGVAAGVVAAYVTGTRWPDRVVWRRLGVGSLLAAVAYAGGLALLVWA